MKTTPTTGGEPMTPNTAMEEAKGLAEEAKELAAEFGAAYARLHFARQAGGPCIRLGELVEAKREALFAMIERLALNAARYEWLREADWIDCHIEESHGIIGLSPSTLDAAIDASRAAGGETHHE
jgi:hypothetical protein